MSINTIEQLKNVKKEDYGKIHFVGITDLILEDDFKNIFNFINLYSICIHVPKPVINKYKSKFAILQKLQYLSLYDRRDSKWLDEINLFENKLLLYNVNIDFCVFNLITEKENFAKIKSINTFNLGERDNLLYDKTFYDGFLHNLPEDLEYLQVSINVYKYLDNLPLSLRELVLIVKPFNLKDFDKDKIINYIKLPMNCNFKILYATSDFFNYAEPKVLFEH